MPLLAPALVPSTQILQHTRDSGTRAGWDNFAVSYCTAVLANSIQAHRPIPLALAPGSVEWVTGQVIATSTLSWAYLILLLLIYPGVAQDEVKVSYHSLPICQLPKYDSTLEVLPICQGLADEEEVPPLLPGLFGPIGWNGWGEKQPRQ